MVYELIRRRMDDIIPLNKLVGIEILSIGDGVAEACVALRPDLTNHIGSAHATLIFGVAEAASGAAMSGALAPSVADIRPVAAQAQIAFLKIAKSNLTAKARVSESTDALRARLAETSKVVFDVNIGVFDEANDEIAQVTVNWHVSKR
jgi:acyl-coenzyme A thioesterase PaaI-like protein